MNSVFDNFDLFCEEIYKEFKIDVRGGESEYKILGYMVYTAVKKAYENIEASQTLLTQGELELFAFHINEAIFAIASITTAFERDEILESMFSSFCVGK